MKKSYKLIVMCLLLMPILAMIGGCGSQSKQIGSSGSKEADTSGYLAFGPYIALAVGVYCALFDLVQYLAGLYLSLFK